MMYHHGVFLRWMLTSPTLRHLMLLHSLQSLDQAPLSPAHDPVYPVYLAPSDDDLEPIEAQPLSAFVSPTALLLDYSVDSEPVEEDPEVDPEEEPSEKEEELLALADSPPAGLYIDLPSETSLVAAPTPSPLSPLSSPLPRIPSPPLLLPPPTRRDIIPEADMPPRKRARFVALSQRFEIRESSSAATSRQSGSTLDRGTDYGFVTALEEVDGRVTDLATSHRHDIKEFYVCHQDAQDDIAILWACISSLVRQRCYHRTMAIVAEQEATYA
ncbi:hypothetical protein Tco_1126447 [Tanacetum coccineum]